jgi:hypothetical protein
MTRNEFAEFERKHGNKIRLVSKGIYLYHDRLPLNRRTQDIYSDDSSQDLSPPKRQFLTPQRSQLSLPQKGKFPPPPRRQSPPRIQHQNCAYVQNKIKTEVMKFLRNEYVLPEKARPSDMKYIYIGNKEIGQILGRILHYHEYGRDDFGSNYVGTIGVVDDRRLYDIVKFIPKMKDKIAHICYIIIKVNPSIENEYIYYAVIPSKESYSNYKPDEYNTTNQERVFSKNRYGY